MISHSIDMASLFWSKVSVRGDYDCWEWLEGKTKSGYGVFYPSAKGQRAHRFSYELCCDAIPDGLMVCHSCDNPACVSPAHLFLDTQAGNMADMVRKGRHAKGEINGQSKLSQESVCEIRALFKIKSNTELAAFYGVARKTIADIRDKKTWVEADDA